MVDNEQKGHKTENSQGPEQITRDKKYDQIRLERIKGLRQQRAQQLDEGTITSRRLAFIKNLVDSSGLTYAEIAQKLGKSVQSLSYNFNVADDCNLSTAQEILALLNVSCKVHFELPEKTRLEETKGYEFRGNILVPGRTNLPDFLMDVSAGSRIRFLVDAIIESELILQEFMDKTGMNRNTLNRYIDKEDIKISAICKIGNSLNAKIIWELNKIEKPSR